ncbi:hypothetical protein GJ496_004279 [Pomphorhynchus laevis]|nr:hypothetical protein GJ496_004279 [Pomphorhynchus laevis]
MSKLLSAQRLRRHRHMLSHIERPLNTKQLERQGLQKMQRIYNENTKFCEEIAVDEKLKATDMDISQPQPDNRNQTNFTEVDNGLNGVRTSNEKVTDLPGEDEEEPTAIYIGSALVHHYFSSEGFAEGIISMSAGEMMTIEADNGDGRTKIENVRGKKKRNVKHDVDDSSDDDISIHGIEEEDDDVNEDSDEGKNEDD